MIATQTRSAPAAPLDTAAALLVAEIEQYLTTHPAAPRTAHPLVSKTTEQLVAEALGTPATAPVLTPPSMALRILPDWVLSIPAVRQLHGAGRHITVAEHLTLTALVIERYGWQSGTVRSRSGRRCILGAQAALFRLGYGDEATARAAGARLEGVLRDRGTDPSIHRWNDAPGRTQDEVLYLLRQAATAARGTR